MKRTTQFRRDVIDFVVRHAGRRFAARYLEWLRDLANFALGAGSASLALGESGESEMLKRLAHAWEGREVITIVDVGAHRGDYAAAVRAAFGNRALIHCFEPDSLSFDVLNRSTGTAPMTHCHRLGLGAAPGKARLFTDRSSSPLASLHPETFDIAGIPPVRSHEISVETLDRLASRLKIDRLDLLKIDVEGHELAVLEGARQLLANEAITAVQFEFGERNLASRTFLRDFFELLGHDYEVLRLAPRGLAKVDYRPACEVFVLETNYLAVRRDATVNGRAIATLLR